MQGETTGKCALEEAYTQERARLFSLASKDEPQGEYRKPVFGEGARGSKILLIGEAPGAEEAKLGHPFVGKAGKQLERTCNNQQQQRAVAIAIKNAREMGDLSENAEYQSAKQDQEKNDAREGNPANGE